MVGSKFDLNGLCFDQLKQRERLCVLFCFPSFVMKLGGKNVKTADSLSLLLDRQFMELSFILIKKQQGPTAPAEPEVVGGRLGCLWLRLGHLMTT